MMYQECKLTKGDQEIVRWLPEKFAVSGSTVGLKQEDESWDEGWYVAEVYPQTRTEQDATAARDAYRHHRKNTDA